MHLIKWPFSKHMNISHTVYISESLSEYIFKTWTFIWTKMNQNNSDLFSSRKSKNASCLLFFFSSLAWFKTRFMNVFDKKHGANTQASVCGWRRPVEEIVVLLKKKKKRKRKKHAEYLRHCICITPVELNSYTFSSHFNKMPNNKKKNPSGTGRM